MHQGPSTLFVQEPVKCAEAYMLLVFSIEPFMQKLKTFFGLDFGLKCQIFAKKKPFYICLLSAYRLQTNAQIQTK